MSSRKLAGRAFARCKTTGKTRSRCFLRCLDEVCNETRSVKKHVFRFTVLLARYNRGGSTMLAQKKDSMLTSLPSADHARRVAEITSPLSLSRWFSLAGRRCASALISRPSAHNACVTHSIQSLVALCADRCRNGSPSRLASALPCCAFQRAELSCLDT